MRCYLCIHSVTYSYNIWPYYLFCFFVVVVVVVVVVFFCKLMVPTMNTNSWTESLLGDCFKSKSNKLY